MKQRVSANAIQALKDALTAAFWFKRDLYNYAKGSVAGDPTFLVGIGWTDSDTYKRDSVSTFVDRLVREQDEHQDLLLALMVDVGSMTEFPQLVRSEDAGEKIEAAKEAVGRLKALVKPYEQALSDAQAARDKLTAARAHSADRRASAARIAELKSRYDELLGLAPNERGFALEPLMRDVFDAFDLDPKASFRITGEQIDGGFSLDQEHYLLEAKWEASLAGREDLDVFVSKIARKAENTLGLFVAISGFAPNAIEIHSGHQSPLLLMDGADLYAVLEGRMDLRDLLRRKRRHAAMRGEIWLAAATVLRGT